MFVSPAKTAEPIEMRFGGWLVSAKENHVVLDWIGSPREGAVFDGCPAHWKALVVFVAVYAANSIIQVSINGTICELAFRQNSLTTCSSFWHSAGFPRHPLQIWTLNMITIHILMQKDVQFLGVSWACFKYVVGQCRMKMWVSLVCRLQWRLCCRRWRVRQTIHHVLVPSSSTRRSVVAVRRPCRGRRPLRCRPSSTDLEPYGRSSPATATRRPSSATRPTNWSFYSPSSTPPSIELTLAPLHRGHAAGTALVISLVPTLTYLLVYLGPTSTTNWLRVAQKLKWVKTCWTFRTVV